MTIYDLLCNMDLLLREFEENVIIVISGLKSLILKKSLRVFYIHCFAHQLELMLVVLAKIHL